MKQHILIIGGNGGIAHELISQYCQKSVHNHVYSVSRSGKEALSEQHYHYSFDTCDEDRVKYFLEDIKAQSIRFDIVICATGVLHKQASENDPSQLKPEKRLEDLSPTSLATYFKVNTILPALWLKYLVKVINKDKASLVFFSARVGSISENALGGWYGYRASKSALNMIVKTASIEYKRRAPNSILACYHPGTVDTGLSKPFQANVKPGKLFTPQYTTERLIAHIENFDSEHSPYYIDWDGQTIQY